MKKLTVNGFGVNTAIQFNPDVELMKKARFTFHEKTDNSEAYWSYYRCFRYISLEVGFSVHWYVEPNKFHKNDQLDIAVLDEDFCQPYDYQFILDNHPDNKYAQAVKEFVEKEMDKLQKLGLISGHVKGEYI